MKNNNSNAGLDLVYRKLYSFFGPQCWWPGESPFEVMVGAILTQNTNWANVEKAIINLKSNKLLKPAKLHNISQKQLAKLIKPAGYYNIKAKRLKNLLDFFIGRYDADIKKISKPAIDKIRQELLSVNGIGQETADSIILYALNKPVFVVDAYTKRMLARHHLIPENADYKQVQELFMQNLKKNVKLFNEYHALIVKLGKDYCRKTKPKCDICPLKGL